MIKFDDLNIAIGIQARTGSTRLPAKCLKNLIDKPMWLHSYNECSSVLTTKMLIPDNDYDMIESCKKYNIDFITGPEYSPLKRYQAMCNALDLDYIVRVTSDCPMVNRYIVADMINIATTEMLPYLQCEMDGMDVQIIRRDMIFDKMYINEEHVMDIQKLKMHFAYHPYEMHLSVDTQENFDYVEKLMKGVSL